MNKHGPVAEPKRLIQPPSNWWVRWGKRAFDVCACSISAIVWGPILGLELLVVLVADGRPLFFRQVRVGLDSRPFVILKVRTMMVSPGKAQGGLFADWTRRGDTRVTPVGRNLRRWRLDELPQMICVLRGQMSLVGPRPEMVDVAAHLSKSLPAYASRHQVRPGMTGLCQISSSYLLFETMDHLEARLDHDIAYVESLSMASDLKIIFHTFPVLAKGVGIA